MPARDRTSLGILAGGQGRRLGGVDKAFVRVRGTRLLDRVRAAAGEGFAETLVSHNAAGSKDRLQVESEGLCFVADGVAAGEGPLAGIHALLQAATGEWLLTLPVDLGVPTPAVVDALLRHEGAVARDADGLQPLVALWPIVEARRVVRAALEHGERAAHPLVAALGLQVVDVSPVRLGNLNTPRDFEELA